VVIAMALREWRHDFDEGVFLLVYLATPAHLKELWEGKRRSFGGCYITKPIVGAYIHLSEETFFCFHLSHSHDGL
jgi:hypothetical protein